MNSNKPKKMFRERLKIGKQKVQVIQVIIILCKYMETSTVGYAFMPLEIVFNINNCKILKL